MTDLARLTSEIFAHRALNYEVGASAMDWGWAMIDAGWQSDNLFALTALTPPIHWMDLNTLIDKIARDLALPQPEDEHAATRWLAHGHLTDIVTRAEADKVADFTDLKKVSRLWFDYNAPDLEVFYKLKHAIRTVEREGQQGVLPGLTRENWPEQLRTAAQAWLEENHQPLASAIAGTTAG